MFPPPPSRRPGAPGGAGAAPGHPCCGSPAAGPGLAGCSAPRGSPGAAGRVQCCSGGRGAAAPSAPEAAAARQRCQLGLPRGSPAHTAAEASAPGVALELSQVCQTGVGEPKVVHASASI